jgi:4-amino-4-deoxy-L-arabinose transferase-like glycosyltransferase
VRDENADSFRSRPSRREYLFMGILVGGALLFRLLFLGCRRVLSGDEVHYAESLFRFLHGSFLGGVSDYWSFLYPFAGVPFGFLAGNVEMGLRLLSVASGAALAIPVALIARRLWGKRAALFAGLFAVLHPNLISFSTAAMTETFYSLLLLCATLQLLRSYDEPGYRRHAAAGALLALASLVRPEATVILFLFAAAALAGRGGAGSTASFSLRARRSLALGALFVIVLIPYVLLLHAATGRWTGGSKAAVNLSSPVVWQDDLAREEYVYRLNDEGSARRIDDMGRENAFRILWRQKGAISSRYLAKLGAGFKLLPPLFSSPFLLLLVPLGLLGSGWRGRDRGTKVLLLLLGLFPFAFYAVFKVEFRYLVPYLPIHLMWAGAGCAALIDWFGRVVSAKRVYRRALVVLIFLSLVPYSIRKYTNQARSEPVEWRRIGEWVRDHEAPAPRILAKSGCSVSYYAGNPLATYIPWTDVSGLIRFARINRFDYFIADEAYIRAARPTLRSILESPPADLEPIEEFRALDGGKIILYRFRPFS